MNYDDRRRCLGLGCFDHPQWAVKAASNQAEQAESKTAKTGGLLGNGAAAAEVSMDCCPLLASNARPAYLPSSSSSRWRVIWTGLVARQSVQCGRREIHPPHACCLQQRAPPSVIAPLAPARCLALAAGLGSFGQEKGAGAFGLLRRRT
jgi:hypothetical protein